MADPKKTIAAFYDAWRTGNADAVDGLVTEDFVDHDPMPGFAADREGMKQTLQAIMGATKDVKMDVAPIVVDGDNAAAHWTMEWTQVGDFMGQVPADGKRLTLRGHDFYALKDGLVSEVWHVEDVFGVMGQLGLIPQGG